MQAKPLKWSKVAKLLLNFQPKEKVLSLIVRLYCSKRNFSDYIACIAGGIIVVPGVPF